MLNCKLNSWEKKFNKNQCRNFFVFFLLSLIFYVELFLKIYKKEIKTERDRLKERDRKKETERDRPKEINRKR